MPMTEAQARASAKWKKKAVKSLKIDLYIKNDTDIIEYLDGMPGKQAYIRQLIRDDMARKKEK